MSWFALTAQTFTGSIPPASPKRQSNYPVEEARCAISAQMFITLSLATVTRLAKNHGDYDKSHRERRHRFIIIANLELGFCLEVHVSGAYSRRV